MFYPKGVGSWEDEGPVAVGASDAVRRVDAAAFAGEREICAKLSNHPAWKF
jgi:hypothetical protein